MATEAKPNDDDLVLVDAFIIIFPTFDFLFSICVGWTLAYSWIHSKKL